MTSNEILCSFDHPKSWREYLPNCVFFGEHKFTANRSFEIVLGMVIIFMVYGIDPVIKLYTQWDDTSPQLDYSGLLDKLIISLLKCLGF